MNGLPVPRTGEPFRRSCHHLTLGGDIIVEEIVRVDKSKYRNGGHNRDERLDELSFHARNSHRLILPHCGISQNPFYGLPEPATYAELKAHGLALLLMNDGSKSQVIGSRGLSAG